MCCGGEIWAAMPVPNCFQLGEIYYFLFQQLKTWRPYAMRGDPGEYPAANDRMAWYQLQDEHSDLDWVLLGVLARLKRDAGDFHLLERTDGNIPYLSGFAHGKRGRIAFVLEADHRPNRPAPFVKQDG